MAHGISLELSEIKPHPQWVKVGPIENRAKKRSYYRKLNLLRFSSTDWKDCDVCKAPTPYLAKSKSLGVHMRLCGSCWPNSLS